MKVVETRFETRSMSNCLYNGTCGGLYKADALPSLAYPSSAPPFCLSSASNPTPTSSSMVQLEELLLIFSSGNEEEEKPDPLAPLWAKYDLAKEELW